MVSTALWCCYYCVGDFCSCEVMLQGCQCASVFGMANPDDAHLWLHCTCQCIASASAKWLSPTPDNRLHVLQCICQCPIAFADVALAPAPATSNSGMAGAGRKLLQTTEADMLDSMSNMMESGCGPQPTQYESFTQVSYLCNLCCSCHDCGTSINVPVNLRMLLCSIIIPCLY